MSARAFLALGATVALAGCDQFLVLEGRVITGEETSYEVFENAHEFKEQSDGKERLSKVKFRLFEADGQKKEFHGYYKYDPYGGDNLNFHVRWQTTSWGERTWERLIVESEGYQSLVMDGKDIPSGGKPKLLLIRLKRLH